MTDRAPTLVLGLALIVLVGLALVFVLGVAGPDQPTTVDEPIDEPATVDDEPASVASAADETADAGPATALPLDVTSDRLWLRVERWPDGELIPGAIVRIEGPSGVLVARAHASSRGRLDLAVPPGTHIVLVTASAPGYAEAAEHVEVSDDLVRIGLVPTTGWLGRVVTPLGAAVPGARVSAHRYWPPRPAYLELEDEELRLTGTEGTAAAVVTDRTNDEGYYWVRPFDDSNVVDLVLAVVGVELASEPVRVPLPLPDQWLPDLVVHPVEPLQGQVVDDMGRPFPDATVLVDWSIGVRRAPDLQVVADGNGWFRAPRHLGAAHVQVLTDGHYFLDATSGSLELSSVRDWITVDADVPRLTATLLGGGHVRGYLKDAATSEPVFDARVDLWIHDDEGLQLVLDSVLSDPRGGFHLVVPPEHTWRALSLDVRAAGYQAGDFGVVSQPRQDASPETFFLSPVPGVSIVRAVVSGGGRDGTSEVSAFLVPPDASDRLAYLPSFELSTTTEAYELIWEDTVADGEEFSFRTDADPASRLLLVADAIDGEGVLVTDSSGPAPLSYATTDLLRLRPPSSARATVVLENLPPGRPLILQQTSWSPLSRRTHTHQRDVAATAEARQTMDIGLSLQGLSFLELRLDRGPVSAPLASSGSWVRSGPRREILLRVREFHVVQGDIVWFAASDWPDLCIALVGPAVPAWRREFLGESDWCVRPSPNGVFRFDGVPEGVYTLMLYLPVGTTGVEVLAQRTVTVEHDVYNLGVWSVRPDEVEHVEIDL